MEWNHWYFISIAWSFEAGTPYQEWCQWRQVDKDTPNAPQNKWCSQLPHIWRWVQKAIKLPVKGLTSTLDSIKMTFAQEEIETKDWPRCVTLLYFYDDCQYVVGVFSHEGHTNGQPNGAIRKGSILLWLRSWLIACMVVEAVDQVNPNPHQIWCHFKADAYLHKEGTWMSRTLCRCAHSFDSCETS